MNPGPGTHWSLWLSCRDHVWRWEKGWSTHKKCCNYCTALFTWIGSKYPQRKVCTVQIYMDLTLGREWTDINNKLNINQQLYLVFTCTPVGSTGTVHTQFNKLHSYQFIISCYKYKHVRLWSVWNGIKISAISTKYISNNFTWSTKCIFFLELSSTSNQKNSSILPIIEGKFFNLFYIWD